MTETLGVSIIIVNYNNARFLAAAIDSALNQTHPISEVIVVDDASTDNSKEIILGYAGRIKTILREVNGQQVAALSSAWPRSSHPILMFLDSDDVLLPHAAATIAELWTPLMAKAQFLLASVDETGRDLGHVAPKLPPNLDTEQIRAELLRTGTSPSAPGSGNAYSRSLLERVAADGGFNLDDPRQFAMDCVLECNAPFYGEVATIYQPLAHYRIHDRNRSLQDTVAVARFTTALRRFDLKLGYLEQRCRTWGIPFDSRAARDSSLWALECRLIATKLAVGEKPRRECLFYILRCALKSFDHAPLSFSNRLIRIVWFFCVAIAPRFVAMHLIALRFIVSLRPAWFERLFNVLRVSRTRWRPRSVVMPNP
jgi:glycosyltransferase involved in cell wall biosynthesis